jgi:hypothetical protein
MQNTSNLRKIDAKRKEPLGSSEKETRLRQSFTSPLPCSLAKCSLCEPPCSSLLELDINIIQISMMLGSFLAWCQGNLTPRFLMSEESSDQAIETSRFDGGYFKTATWQLDSLAVRFQMLLAPKAMTSNVPTDQHA